MHGKISGCGVHALLCKDGITSDLGSICMAGCCKGDVGLELVVHLIASITIARGVFACRWIITFSTLFVDKL